MIRRSGWHLLFWGCAMAVLVFSLMPIVPHLPTTGWDKGNHFLAFAVLTILGCRAFPAHIAAVLAGLLVYGGLIELLQFFTSYRLAEWADLVADGLGIIVGYALKRFSSKSDRAGQPD